MHSSRLTWSTGSRRPRRTAPWWLRPHTRSRRSSQPATRRTGRCRRGCQGSCTSTRLFKNKVVSSIATLYGRDCAHCGPLSGEATSLLKEVQRDVRSSDTASWARQRQTRIASKSNEKAGFHSGASGEPFASRGAFADSSNRGRWADPLLAGLRSTMGCRTLMSSNEYSRTTGGTVPTT